MSDKPKFGVDAQVAEEPKAEAVKPAAKSATTGDQTAFGVGAGKPSFGADAQTPGFGVNADPKPEASAKKAAFGTQASAPASAQSRSVGRWIADLFGMQPASFWVKQYAFGLLALFIYVGLAGGNHVALAVVNLLLYPFTVTILQELGRNRKSQGTVSAFFFGFSVAMVGRSLWWLVFYGVIRFAIFMFKYFFSILIGGIGLIYMISQSKKLNA